MNKYLNEAIIGNKNMLATFTEKGELQRLYFPCKDHKQYIDFFHTGVKINTSDLIYLHDDINNVYKQYYDTDTNVLNTEVVNTYFNLQMLQTDFILIKENVLVKKYLFINESTIDLDTKFYIHSGLLTDQNNMVGTKIVEGGMLQYAHDFSVSTFAKGYEIEKHQINGSKNTIKRGEIQDKDYIGMSADCSISYNLGVIKPGEKKEICICILVGENTNISDLEDSGHRVSGRTGAHPGDGFYILDHTDGRRLMHCKFVLFHTDLFDRLNKRFHRKRIMLCGNAEFLFYFFIDILGL